MMAAHVFPPSREYSLLQRKDESLTPNPSPMQDLTAGTVIGSEGSPGA